MQYLGRIVGLMGLLAALAIGMHAQESLVANVPFSFEVNRQVLPAGSYVFRQVSSTDLRTISIQGEGKGVFALSSIGGDSNGVPVLSFRRVNDQYVLTRISGLETQVEFPLSREQKQLVKNAAQTKVLALVRK